MSPRKKALPFYTEEELKLIKEQWLRDKQSVDSDPAYEYYVDRWFAYKKFLHNKNLQALYGHAAQLYRLLQDNELYFVYKDEDIKITKAFKRIIENGYYSRSKEDEKKVRVHLGKIVKRQTYRRFKK